MDSWCSEPFVVCAVKEDLPEGSFMLAAYLDADSAKKVEEFTLSLGIRSKEVFGPEYYHLSLRNWVGAQNRLEPFIKWLRDNENIFPASVGCLPAGLEILGPSKSLVLLLRCSNIRQIQNRAERAMNEIGLPPSKFPQFLPHISIAEGVEEIPEAFPDFPIVIDSFKLVDKHDYVYWRSD